MNAQQGDRPSEGSSSNLANPSEDGDGDGEGANDDRDDSDGDSSVSSSASSSRNSSGISRGASGDSEDSDEFAESRVELEEGEFFNEFAQLHRRSFSVRGKYGKKSGSHDDTNPPDSYRSS